MNEIVQAMVTRRSCRQYWDRPVPEELLDQVLLAGTYAANGRGRQAGRIVVLTKKEDITALEKLNVQALGNPEAQPFYGAPVVLVVLADKSVHTAVEDGSLVIGNMLLAAHALGLGACWIHRAREEFESPEGKTLLAKWGITGDYIGVGHCILGYPASAPQAAAPPSPPVPGSTCSGRTAPKTRCLWSGGCGRGSKQPSSPTGCWRRPLL